MKKRVSELTLASEPAVMAATRQKTTAPRATRIFILQQKTMFTSEGVWAVGEWTISWYLGLK